MLEVVALSTFNEDDSPGYAVTLDGSIPAWEEWGYGDLEGPFATREEALAAVAAHG